MSGSWTRIGALALKEAFHIRRDPRTLLLALGLPVLLLLLFGYGVSFDLDQIPVAVVDQEQSAASRALLRRVFSSSELSRRPLDADPVERLMAPAIEAVIILPPNWTSDRVRGRPAPVQLLVSGIDGTTAQQASSKTAAALEAATPRARSAEPPSGPQPEVRVWFNPENDSSLFLVPGLAAYVVAIIAVLLTALTVAREWELGSMEQLFATPVGRLEIVVGKLLPYLVLGLGAVTLVLSVGALVFGVPFRGSFVAVALASLLFVLGMLAQGLLISVVTKNQMVATQAAAMSSVLPTILLSGFLFPIENMPAPLQVVTRIIPAQYYITVLRGALLRGNGLMELWPSIGALALFALILITIATGRFQRRLA